MVNKKGRPPSTNDFVKKGIYFSKQDWEDIGEIAKKERTTPSYLTRKAMQEFIQKYLKAHKEA